MRKSRLLATLPMWIVAGLALAMFDGTPTTPQPFTTHSEYANWDVQVHSRDVWSYLDAMQAEHGTNCSAPPATHSVSAHADAVFVCNEHLMTAINAAGYGVIYLTPSKLLDWSNGPATLTFDVSTHRSSTRDWIDLWLQDFNGNIALPLEGGLPDLQANNGSNIQSGHQYLHIDGDGNIKGFPNARANGSAIAGWQSNLQWTADSSTQRDTYQLTINATTFSFCKLTGEPTPICWANNLPHGLTITQATVQLGHHSYNPTKDGAGSPGTWHWDNVTLSPSVPFTLIKTGTRAVFGSGGVLTFNAPAPENAYLRFSAIGKVTVNGQVVAPLQSIIHDESLSSYFVPIPAGTQQVTIGLSPNIWYSGPFEAKDFSIWAQSTSATPTATAPTPTSTSTPTPVPSSTPTPVAPSPTPTSTSVPAGQCETWIKQANGQYILLTGVIEKWTRLPNGTYVGPQATSQGMC